MEGSDYLKMRQAGATPHQTHKQARRDGVPLIATLKMLREVFGLSLIEAKEVWVQAEGLAPSLEKYQEQLLPELQDALDAAEHEDR